MAFRVFSCENIDEFEGKSPSLGLQATKDLFSATLLKTECKNVELDCKINKINLKCSIFPR